MVQSLNTKVTLTCAGTSHLGLSSYGQLMIGDRAFEFYAEANPQNFIQIPWAEVDYVVVSALLKGKWIPRFGLKIKSGSVLTFSARDPKLVLRTIREYIPAERIVHSLSFFQVLWRRFHRRK
ncbi:DUF956 family protein [Lactobacillus sp. DCY120]|uniref:DUF956 family protein n=1 Tax=Bombilactobacillus apium TaxID=2675299 RepID=A0A850R1Q1_9LACO|nr:DUF956 family protein [Bombilactobacillus apium]NVY95951.1 DUF956 family protein [Bombilactobacillus apium]